MRKFYAAASATLLFLLVSVSANTFGQSTYSKVYTILSANCQGSGCHGGNGPGQSGLDFSLPDSTVYTAIIGKTPVNPRAAAKGDKIIDPGYPERSFLLRKIAQCMDPDLALEPAEGDQMPQGRPALADSSIELIRQWIIQAAPKLGMVVDTDKIAAYYGNANHLPRITPPAPPQPCEGFQVHLGPIFLSPGQENEWFKRYDLKNPDSYEVNRLDLFMNDESHHFILRKYQAGTQTQFPQSMELLNPLTAFDQNKDYVMAWQDNGDINLPNGTAYKWPSNTSIDLNYHVKNYNSSVYAVDVYLNIYTQPTGTAIKEMKSELINEVIFGITPGDTTVKKNNVFNHTNASIWSITSHTHKYAIDYDVYLRKPNGSKGDQVFEGYYNTAYTFNQGFYSWEHPPTRRFEPLLYMGDVMSTGEKPAGLIHEAKWYNYGNTTVNFGFTTADEMMIIYVQYVDGAYPIPAQGYVAPNCPAVPYVNPCAVTTQKDTVGLHTGDTVTGRNSTVILNGTNNNTGTTGDTITITADGHTYTFVITATGGPYSFGNGDVVTSSPGGTVFLNGVPIGYMPAGLVGVANVADNMSSFNVYPNPFEGHTTIDYSLGENSSVSLEVFNLLGQRVETMVNNEKQTAGDHKFIFTPAKTSGIYLVKLTVNGTTTVKKVSVL